jgi:hypothetical protein
MDINAINRNLQPPDVAPATPANQYAAEPLRGGRTRIPLGSTGGPNGDPDSRSGDQSCPIASAAGRCIVVKRSCERRGSPEPLCQFGHLVIGLSSSRAKIRPAIRWCRQPTCPPPRSRKSKHSMTAVGQEAGAVSGSNALPDLFKATVGESNDDRGARHAVYGTTRRRSVSQNSGKETEAASAP